jgi:outer membrane protein OmpA-like peptidoglycan-associated protein
VNRASLLLAVALAGACGPQTATPEPVAVPPAAADLTTEVDDARTGIPRVAGDDVTPQFTTRTTVLAGNRPATVLTLPEAVLFDFGSAGLRPEAESVLAGVVDLFRQQPRAQAEVAGHSDSVGSTAFNQSLSQARAGAVVSWLVDHGVPADRLRAAGYGATRPVAGNATEDDRRRNRRVEITVS